MGGKVKKGNVTDSEGTELYPSPEESQPQYTNTHLDLSAQGGLFFLPSSRCPGNSCCSLPHSENVLTALRLLHLSHYDALSTRFQLCSISKWGLLFLKIQTSESCVNPLNGAADERHFCCWNTHLNKSISSFKHFSPLQLNRLLFCPDVKLTLLFGIQHAIGLVMCLLN